MLYTPLYNEKRLLDGRNTYTQGNKCFELKKTFCEGNNNKITKGTNSHIFKNERKGIFLSNEWLKKGE